MNMLNQTLILLGRLLLSLIFLAAGYSKLTDYAATQLYMEMMGVSASLLPLVIATEMGAGLAILIGFQTRVAALGLAGFTVLSALFFHSDFADPMQSILLMKNLAMAGGLLVLVSNGAGKLSLDNVLMNQQNKGVTA